LTLVDTGSTASYIYNAEGARVHENVGGTVEEFLNGDGPQGLTIVDASQNPVETDYSFGGRPLATATTGGLFFAATDTLGTVRARLNASGAIVESDTSWPYGEFRNYANSISRLHFTGKLDDTESGLDYFGARYYSSSLGRFMTPDPLGGDLTNPQSLNRYAYAWNNPVTFTDPTGMYVCADAKPSTPRVLPCSTQSSSRTLRMNCSTRRAFTNGGGCNSKADKAFAKSLAGLLKSKDKAVLRSAQAYGSANDDNGVTVGFGKTTDGSATDTNAGYRGNPDGVGLQATASVVFQNGLSGSALDAAVGHEGTHVANAQDFINSVSADATSFNAALNLTKYQNETSAYLVTASILASEGVKLDYGTALIPAPLGAGVSAAGTNASIQSILASPLYKLTPTSPGLPIYPEFTVPH